MSTAGDTPSPTQHPTDPVYDAIEEQLVLPDGRTLAYSHSGPADASLLVIWFHGLFSVGDAARPSAPLRARGVRFLAPTLPGWGLTSPAPPGASFPETVVADTHALLTHLYPTYARDPAAAIPLRIFLSGGSFGTCPAQIVFGAPYARFPFGHAVAGVMLAAPLSPFAEHAGYARALTWRDWVGVGPLAHALPFRALPRLMAVAVRAKVRDVPSAEGLLREMMFDKMDDEEKGKFRAFRERNGVEEGEFERRMAEGMVKSVSKSWEGFLGTADALHADWGFKIAELDEEHQRKRVVVAVGKEDKSMWRMGKFLTTNYKNAKMIEFEGGHLAAAWAMDGIWTDILADLDADGV